MIMSFGRFVFSAEYGHMVSPNGVKRTLGIVKEDQDQESGKPATLVKGVQLEKLSCETKLIRLFDPTPEKVIAQLEKLLRGRRPERIVIGGRVVGKYRWLLVGLDIDYTILDGDGRIVEAKISLSFDEYVKAGSKTDSVSKKPASAPGVSSVKVNDAYKAKAPTAEERAMKKREKIESTMYDR